MLKRTNKKPIANSKRRIAIVASEYNARFVEGLLEGALNVLGDVEIVRVPGAFEIPVVAARLARRKRRRPATVICLGVILRGETTHAEHIGKTVSSLLGQIAVETGVPIIHEVLLLENEAQARRRCLNKRTNRGAEAAHTALKMGEVMASLG